ncbi:MAG: hypothetical protein JWO67_2241 [Streptosporangiaceae bacterium]|nr:hypothetical protein [Streptosporangiaceae bacterium]
MAPEMWQNVGEAARCDNTERPLTEPPYVEGGSAVGIMLPPDSDRNNWPRSGGL